MLFTIGGYSLSADAVKALKDAKSADAAERVFNSYADHIPRRHRLKVWLGVDNVDIF